MVTFVQVFHKIEITYLSAVCAITSIGFYIL